MRLMADIYIAINRQQSGPFSEEEVRARFARGELQLADMYWIEGMAKWEPLGQWLGSTSPSLLGVAPPPFSDPLAPPPLPRQYAGFWIRFGAIILDGLLSYIVVGLPLQIFQKSILPPPPTNPQDYNAAMAYFEAAMPLILMFTFIHIIVDMLYYSIMESSTRQATLGKMACGLVVTDLQGDRISFGQAIGRYFAKSFISTFFTLCIGLMMAGWTEKKQALHDMICGTLVVRRDQNR